MGAEEEGRNPHLIQNTNIYVCSFPYDTNFRPGMTDVAYMNYLMC